MAQEVDTGAYKLDFTQLFANMDKAAAQDTAFRAAIEQTGSVAKKSFTEAAQQALSYQTRLASATMEVRTAAGVYADLRGELAKTVQSQRELERSQKTTAAGADAVRLSRELEQNRKKQAELRIEIDLTKKAIEAERDAVQQVKAAQQATLAQQKLATAAAKDAAQAQKEANKDSGGFFGSLLGKLSGVTAGLFTVNKLFGTIRQGVEDFRALSGIQSTFTAIAGSAQGGAREIAFVTEQANKLGLELIPTAKAYTSLFAASREANIPLETTRSLFVGLTDAGRVLGRSQSEVESAIRAVEQMISKGTVSSQELKLQLGNALPGAFGLAAKAAGLTTAEFTKQIATGKVLAADFLPKLARQLKQTYGDATADAATQASANLGRINTFITNQSARLGALFGPAIKAAADFVAATETAAQKSERLVSAYTNQNTAFAEQKQNIEVLLLRYNDLNGITGRNTEQQQSLDEVMRQLAKSVPGAVTEFDKYGKALGINSEAVKQFIKDQENLVRYNNKQRLQENSGALRELIAEQEKLTQDLNNTVTGADGLRRRQVVDAASAGTGGANAVVRTLSQAESDRITNELTTQLSKVQDDIRANLQNRQILRGKNPLVPQLSEEDLKDNLGLIEKQQKLIEELQKRQKSAQDENQQDGTDFLFGAKGINQQLEAAQKELDRLLGKRDKERSRKGPDYLKQLLAAEAKLRDEADKLELAQLKDQGEARAKEQLQQSLDEINRTEANLVRLERLAGRDGQIDGVQQRELDSLRAGARDTYFRELRRIAQEQSDALFALQADSDAKEVEAVERKYAKLFFEASANKDRLVALEAAKGRELLALQQKQEQDRIQNSATQQTDTVRANIGQVFGEGTGQSVIQAKEREKEELLRIDLEKNEALLNNSLLLADEQGQIVRAALRTQIAELTNSINQIEQQKKRLNPEESLYRLILGENDSAENREQLDAAVSASVNALNQIVQAEAQLQEARIQASTRRIDDLNTALLQEIALNKEGSASNIGTLKEQIKEEKAARREAVAERKKNAKEQILIDTLLQASSVVTAAAQALSAFPIPIVGPALGIIAAGLIVGAFVASKVKAFQAVNKQSEGFFKGGYTGDGNPREESRAVGRRSYVYHKAEYVMPHEVTAAYRFPLLEPLHKGRPDQIDWSHPKMQQLLPDYSLPGKLREERRQVVEHRHEVAYAPMQASFSKLEARMEAVEKNTNRIPAKQYVSQPDGSLLVIDTRSGNQTTYRMG